MKYIENLSTDPYWNLALEEYVQTTFRSGDIVLLWQNDSTVVIGKNQNALVEVRREEAERLGVTVVRRNTGGGAVYHDMGNLNFSFITDWRTGGVDYDTFVRPVIRALGALGVTAEKSGRNDIVVEGRKISGNAQCVHEGRILHHGTLLLDSDLSMMPKVLRVSADKIASKGIKSVRSRVANIREFLPAPISIDTLKGELLRSFASDVELEQVSLSPADLEAVGKLREEKYSTWAWNFGASPQYTYHNAARTPRGQIEVFLQINSGQVEQCRIMGDFLALYPIDRLEKALTGVRYSREALTRAIADIDTAADYGIEAGDLIACLTDE